MHARTALRYVLFKQSRLRGHLRHKTLLDPVGTYVCVACIESHYAVQPSKESWMTSQHIEAERQTCSKHWILMTRRIEHSTAYGRSRQSRRLQGFGGCKWIRRSGRLLMGTCKLCGTRWEGREDARQKAMVLLHDDDKCAAAGRGKEDGVSTGSLGRASEHRACRACPGS